MVFSSKLSEVTLNKPDDEDPPMGRGHCMNFAPLQPLGVQPNCVVRTARNLELSELLRMSLSLAESGENMIYKTCRIKRRVDDVRNNQWWNIWERRVKIFTLTIWIDHGTKEMKKSHGSGRKYSSSHDHQYHRCLNFPSQMGIFASVALSNGKSECWVQQNAFHLINYATSPIDRSIDRLIDRSIDDDWRKCDCLSHLVDLRSILDVFRLHLEHGI